jgi:hypothetical protein
VLRSRGFEEPQHFAAPLPVLPVTATGAATIAVLFTKNGTSAKIFYFPDQNFHLIN